MLQLLTMMSTGTELRWVLDHIGGCSCLLEENTFFHFDSVKTHNYESAEKTVQNISKYLINPKKVKFENYDTPQQRNGVDCGVYLILILE